MNNQISQTKRWVEVIDMKVQYMKRNEKQNLIYILFGLMLSVLLGISRMSMAAEGIWTTKSPMPTARFIPSSGVVDGKIYVIGGTPDGYICFPTVEEYDPATDTWTKKANMPMSNGTAATSVVNGRIYVIGGRPSLHGAPYSRVIEYDATTDTWTAKANMPTARSWLSGSVVDGKIYAIGGALTYRGTTLSRVEEYDPATDTWTRKADMPTARACLSTSAVNGKIYAIGGTLSNPWYRGLSTVEEYDPATDTWTKKADMTTPRTYISTCAVNGKIYAIGGLTTGSNHLSPVEEYDPATDTWTRKADMPTARSGLATSAVNSKMYAIGGWGGSNYTGISTVEEYDPFPLVVDFNGDFKVDFEDFSILAQYWLQIAPELFGDHMLDYKDLAALADYWLKEVLPLNLIAYWKLNETEGTVAHDSAGDKDGVLMTENPLWRPLGGQVDGALEFDGVDDFAFTSFVLDPDGGPLSVFAWVRGGDPGQVILSQASSANWLLANSATGALMTELKGGFFGKALSSQAVITDGDWHRVGLTWDGSTRILFVDDVEVAKDTQAALAPSDRGLNIGAAKNLSAGSLWSGLIDDVRIYNRAVTP